MGWIASGAVGPGAETPLPPVIVGSSDPLLDWALRQSDAGLAAYFDGSHDGLARLARRDAVAAALHVHEDGGGWNVAAVREAVGTAPVVLVEFARRERGLILPRSNPHEVAGLADLSGRRVARRQLAAASERLFVDLAGAAGLDAAALPGPGIVARTEEDLALIVAEGKADAAFGLRALAERYRLDFVPVIEERFDLLFWQSAYFGPECQKLLQFLGGAAFAARAAEMPGYDISRLGRVVAVA
jgi:molybdate-binding protein